MIKTDRKFSKHIILNGDKTSFMGNLKMYYGDAFWNKKGENDKEVLFALSDCHNVARIHSRNSTKKEIKKFIKKLRKIANGANEFADFLQNTITGKYDEI